MYLLTSTWCRGCSFNTSQPVISPWGCGEHFLSHEALLKREKKKLTKANTGPGAKSEIFFKKSSLVSLNRSVFRQQWQSVWRQSYRPIGRSGVHRLADPPLSPRSVPAVFAICQLGPWDVPKGARVEGRRCAALENKWNTLIPEHKVGSDTQRTRGSGSSKYRTFLISLFFFLLYLIGITCL